MVRVCLTLELVKLLHLDSLSQRPFDNTTVTRDRDQRFFLAFALDPTHLPNDVVVLVRELVIGGFGLGDRHCRTRLHALLHVVDGNVAM